MSLKMNPHGRTPLAGELSVIGHHETTLSVTVEGPDTAWTIEVDTPRLEHRVPILGLEPSTAYRVSISTFADGTATHLPSIQVDTPGLPSPFPELVLESNAPGRMEPGLTMFDLGGTDHYLVIVDDDGNVVWLYVAPGPGIGDVRLLPSGNLLFLSGGDIYEMTMLGEIVRHVEARSRDRRFHHEAFPTPEGTYITLGLQVTEVPDFPASESDPALAASADVTDDTILEVAPDGSVLRRYALLDILDRGRIAYDSLAPHLQLGTPNDWAHANAIILDGERVIVSARHQDAIFNVDRETGALAWIVAPHENWSDAFQPYLLTPVGDAFAWSYHQHAPEMTVEGTLLLFDNGNRRASPFDGVMPMPAADSYSRAVEYRIDEQAMTIEQVWSYGADLSPKLFGGFIGDADLMPETGNVLITFGGLTAIGGVNSEDMGRGRFQSKLIEVERTAENAVVFELSIYSSLDENPMGFRAYRSERIPHFHPSSSP